ncbi:MAG TPA: DUF6492 family protein [Paenibacillus sp.]|uniref:DUF6492 family protein n=1 Tax=Paenibacillus sp. TaxID=58172 RepID=UPI002C86A05D|nr:DUF6492 family protein [Paenibacillus sp.]HUC90475.1 DUF6492 family protein [Paenibacillus sp.]
MKLSLAAHAESGPAIDILIPAIEKDLATLPYVIDGLRKHVKHPVGDIYVVSPGSERIRSLCRRKRCVFVNENTVLPITKRDIHYRSRTWDRSGWLYQQLLKLSGDTVCSRDFLVADADTVFIRPHRFRSNGKTVFYSRAWSQPEYFNTYRKLLGRKRTSPRSLVAHYMLFERAKLRKLKRTIEARHGIPWFKAVIRVIDRTKQFGFSEFETYGNFVYALNRAGYTLRPALNKSLPTGPRRLSASKITKLAKSYRSISFHKRKIYRRSGGKPSDR